MNATDRPLGSNSQLRALADVYASQDAREKVVVDFAGSVQAE